VGLTDDFTPGNVVGDFMREAIDEILEPLPDLNCEFISMPSLEVAGDAIQDYDAVITGDFQWTAQTFKNVERLMLVAYWGIGVDAIDLEAATESDVLVANSPSPANHASTAGTVLAFMLALSMRLFDKDRLTKEGRALDAQQITGTLIENRVVGTIGLGATARRLIEFLRPLRPAKLISCDPYVAPEVAGRFGVQLVTLDDVMRESDFLCVMCTLTDETRGLIDSTRLRQMKPTAFFLNAARGAIVDQAALAHAVREGWIAGAGLDALDPEPPPPDDPILAFDNVITTGHAMAWTVECLRDACVEPCRAVASVYAGKTPSSVVNAEVLDRSGFQSKLQRRFEESVRA
jgi:phosphoglycerate dehydrogenase-like enzyme